MSQADAFVVVDDENPYVAIWEHPDYVRGRYASFQEAVARCEELLDAYFEDLGTAARAENMKYRQVYDLLFDKAFGHLPRIHLPDGTWDEETPSASFERRSRVLLRGLGLSKFEIGERVEPIGPVAEGNKRGSVISLRKPDSGADYFAAEDEIVRVRPESGGPEYEAPAKYFTYAPPKEGRIRCNNPMQTYGHRKR